MSIAALCASKTCSACKAQLPLDAFYENSRCSGGRVGQCKACRKMHAADYVRKNANRRAETSLAWRKANPEKSLAYAQGQRLRDREKNAAKSAQSRIDNPDLWLARDAAYRAKNRDKRNQRAKELRKANPERQKEHSRKYQLANRAIVCAASTRRKAARLSATPSWAGSEFEVFAMEEAYTLAALRAAITGIPYHVDHVVPLRSPLVCGLHCIANLSVIPASVNLAKGNRYWPGMP